MGLTAAEILAEAGIKTRSTTPGRYYTTCPKCSHTRKGSHKNLRCLGVTIDERGVRGGCNHCPFTFGRFYNAERSSYQVAGKARNLSGNSQSFRHIYG